MGMAVFSGMSIATALGVCLVPVLFVAVTKLAASKAAETSATTTPGGGH
jgi:HAE1 family hydrophobic/amphiphilic exporter-1